MAYTFKHGDRPLDGYTVQRAVGRGGFGEVYYALSDGGREVALKYLRENPDVELRGVSHCINLKSPHLVSIFDVKQTHEGEYIIIMEYCSGPTLRDLLIAEPNGFSTEKAAFFARETGKGLSYLHERGIVHRDLKPGNLFFDDGYVKIGDYGLSKFISVSRHSAQTASVGTVHYMAPEIGSGDYSRGVDIYALGVMLYEMLLGKVPFEGSSMAEVLMKHLTAQPELDQLPQPFGHVIRKALAKDPKDRYQTVDEMIEEMLSGEQIQQSLAGFSPKSLDGAVARGGSDAAASPYPSPNPAPGGTPTMPLPARPMGQPFSAMPLPDRLAKRLDRVSRKIERKMGKLGTKVEQQLGKAGDEIPPHGAGRTAAAVPPPIQGKPSGDVPWAVPAPPAGVGMKRFVLTSMLTLGLAIALGLIVGNSGYDEDVAVASGALVIAMRLALALANKACSWFTVEDGPVWAQRMVTVSAAAPLLAGGASPLFDARGGLALFFGLLASAAFANWRKLVDENDGTICAGMIFGKALGAMVLTVIIAGLLGIGNEEEFMFIAAGVAGAAAFIVQAGASWGSWSDEQRRRPQRGLRGTPTGDRAAHRVSEPDTPSWLHGGRHVSIPPNGNESLGNLSGLAAKSLRLRGGFSRFFWALMAFVFSGGAIATFIVNLVGDLPYHGRTGLIIGCIACLVSALFAMTKATPFAKIGFWRGALRPFMLTLFAFGIGATTTGIARNWNHCEKWGEPGTAYRIETHNDVKARSASANRRIAEANQHREMTIITNENETAVAVRGPGAAGANGEVLGELIDEDTGFAGHLGGRECIRYTLCNDARGGLVTGLVLCSLFFLVLLFFTGRKPKSPKTFLQGGTPE